MMRSANERVNEGIKMFDRIAPIDWRLKIDTSKLNISSSKYNPIRQVFGPLPQSKAIRNVMWFDRNKGTLVYNGRDNDEVRRCWMLNLYSMPKWRLSILGHVRVYNGTEFRIAKQADRLYSIEVKAGLYNYSLPQLYSSVASAKRKVRKVVYNARAKHESV